MSLPGHNYLGPGNKTNNGPPVDSDDAIAQQHDIAYSRARSVSSIRSADRQAIGAFAGDFIEEGNWHSAVGAVGLGAKYAAESVIGVQYPRNVGMLCTNFNKYAKNIAFLILIIIVRIILKEVQAHYLKPG